MAKTLIGTKKSILDFLERSMSDNDVIIMTDNWSKVNTHKKGMKIEFQYADDTFKDEKDIRGMMEGCKNVSLWIGPAEKVSADSKRLFDNEIKDTKPTKNDSKSRPVSRPAGRKSTKRK